MLINNYQTSSGLIETYKRLFDAVYVITDAIGVRLPRSIDELTDGELDLVRKRNFLWSSLRLPNMMLTDYIAYSREAAGLVGGWNHRYGNSWPEVAARKANFSNTLFTMFSKDAAAGIVTSFDSLPTEIKREARHIVGPLRV